MTENPYVGGREFIGRAEEIASLTREANRLGVLGAVMAGRGMGKTALASELAKRLRDSHDVISWHWCPVDTTAFLKKLSTDLQYDFRGELFPDEVMEATRARSRPAVLLLDEVDAFVATPAGRTLLDGLRIAWEQLRGRLSVIIFGGSTLHELLESNVSPFLRSAVFKPLRGLSRADTRALICDPLHLNFSDEMVELLWQQTAGHPLLLTRIMAGIVDRGGDPLDHMHEFIDIIDVQDLESVIFPVWWGNLREPGQRLYRAILSHKTALPRVEVAGLTGGSVDQWIRVLETTGVARLEAGELLPRCDLFARWAAQEHFAEPVVAPRIPAHVSVILDGRRHFEGEVLEAIARWCVDCYEHAGLGLLIKEGSKARGNERLMPEKYFQFALLLPLRQCEWQVSAESWSVVGRPDLVIKDLQRCCIEMKIWTRNDYLEVIHQVVGYSMPEDEFACIVMIDRQSTPLTDRYRSAILGDLTVVAHGEGYPQFVTEHTRPVTDKPLRVYHFLLQLPSD